MQDSSSWKEPYLAALRETNKEKLIELVYAAEGAIFIRAQTLISQAAKGGIKVHFKRVRATIRHLAMRLRSHAGFVLPFCEPQERRVFVEFAGCPRFRLTAQKHISSLVLYCAGVVEQNL
jgi:hypothetical protein